MSTVTIPVDMEQLPLGCDPVSAMAEVIERQRHNQPSSTVIAQYCYEALVRCVDEWKKAEAG